MSKTFIVEDIADFITVSEKRMLALSRQSIQDVIDDAQLPVAKGGRMRVDTGFLRASGQPSLSGMPTGPVRGDPNATPGSYDFDAQPTVLALAQLQFGSIFYFGWTANYAKYREAYDGFLEGAAQKWAAFVQRNTEKIRQRISK